MKAVILAAGEGTRLYPLTLETPKPLIEIAGKTILERIFESLPDEIGEVIMIVEHLKEKIISYLGENFKDKKIIYAEQGEKKGTFGALLSAKPYLNNEKFLVLNGDDLHGKVEIEECLKYERAMGVQKMVMPNYYSLILDKDSYFESFRHQTEDEKKRGVWVATGTYVLDTDIFDHPGVVVSGGELGLPQSVFEQKENHPIKVVTTEDWIPINSFVDIEKAESILPDK